MSSLTNKSFGATNAPGTCKFCGRKLRPMRGSTKAGLEHQLSIIARMNMGDTYKEREEQSAREMYERRKGKLGDYGDGHFCGLGCGYLFAVAFASAGSKLKPIEPDEEKPDIVSVDGEEMTHARAEELWDKGKVQRCPDAGGECPHQYHWILNPAKLDELKDVSEVTTADEAREIAIDWQHATANKSMSWMEVANYNAYFEALAAKFNLSDEFKENGII